MSSLRIPTAEVFTPLLKPARYKGAWGGRGSGKSQFFADGIVSYALCHQGARIVCIREVQRSLKDSAKRLIEDKLSGYGLGEAHGFRPWREVVELPGDGIVTFMGMQDHTADSIKSLEGFDIAWVEEAQSLSERSLSLLRPTIRARDSELWFSWNPQRPTDPVDRMLRGPAVPSDSVVVRANWDKNPWFPAVLDQERRDCLKITPERYGHIWDGEYATVLTGAYYARHLTEAEQQGRIGMKVRDPLMKVYAFWDIGGTSRKSDATAIWIAQFISGEIRLIDYYEVVGQPFDSHVRWLRASGYEDAVCVLPHDGRKADTVFSATPEGFLRQAGFVVDTVPNQGAGAALERINAGRAIFPSCTFDREKTQAGRDALGWYHARVDDARGIDLGPDHDYASHCADAFGLAAIYRRGVDVERKSKPIIRNLRGIV